MPPRCVKQHLPAPLSPTLLEFYLISLAAITFSLLLQTCILILRRDFIQSQFFKTISIISNCGTDGTDLDQELVTGLVLVLFVH